MEQTCLKLPIVVMCGGAFLVHMWSEPAHKHIVGLCWAWPAVEAKINDEPWDNNPLPPSIVLPFYAASSSAQWTNRF